MSFRSLNQFGKIRDGKFYITALKYSQYLWLQNLPARSILALNRALFTNLQGNEPELELWPIPYQPLKWILQNYSGNVFWGNPRISYQHIASRVRGHKKDQRRWRAWACWLLVRQVLPQLRPDDKDIINEPDNEQIIDGLIKYGISDEDKIFKTVLST